MPFRVNLNDHRTMGRYVLKWLLLAVPMAGVVGSACALFLWSLDGATNLRWAHPGLLFFLPVAGVIIAALYLWAGSPSEGGNNLIVEQIHRPGGGVPSRVAPLILFSTVLTHLVGGSAGREGTAVQMGGSLASFFCRVLRLSEEDTRTLLMAGVAAGFGGVFGTPLAGAVFAMEVLSIGRMSYEALIPCLIAAVIGDQTCQAWGIHHTDYHQILRAVPALQWSLIGKVLLAAVLFGWASLLFAELTHGFHRIFQRVVPNPLLRPVLGAGILIGLVGLLGTRDYLGLGVSAAPGSPNAVTLLSSFRPGGVGLLSWWWKALFTAVTLGSGFKGGEVTPLFFIGASLGNVLGQLFSVPVDLMAGLGFVAVFAGATNTPLACTLMGMELFGSGPSVYIAVACFFAYVFSGHSGVYLSQRIGVSKPGLPAVPSQVSLRDLRTLIPSFSHLLRVFLSRMNLFREVGSAGKNPLSPTEENQNISVAADPLDQGPRGS